MDVASSKTLNLKLSRIWYSLSQIFNESQVTYFEKPQIVTNSLSTGFTILLQIVCWLDNKPNFTVFYTNIVAEGKEILFV